MSFDWKICTLSGLLKWQLEYLVEDVPKEFHPAGKKPKLAKDMKDWIGKARANYWDAKAEEDRQARLHHSTNRATSRRSRRTAWPRSGPIENGMSAKDANAFLAELPEDIEV